MLHIRPAQFDALGSGDEKSEQAQVCRPSKWIALQYRHADGTGVTGASYEVEGEGGKILLKGRLDYNGFAFQQLQPDAGSITFQFFDDPAEYRIIKGPIDNPENDRVPGLLDQLLDRINKSAEWTWGVVEGDFNRDPDTSQIIARMALTLIPLVDQVGDAEDLIANIFYMLKFYMGEAPTENEFWLWVALVVTAVGCIPELGTAVKGIFKVILRYFRESHAAIYLKRVFREIMAILNAVGSNGNAYRWLKNLVANFHSIGDQVATTIRKILEAIKTALGYTPFIERKDKILHAIESMQSRIKAMVQRVFDWFKEKIELVLSERLDKRPGTSGSINIKRQEALDPHSLPNEPIPPSNVKAGSAKLLNIPVDDVVASSRRASREGSNDSRGLQALKKKLDNPDKNTYYKGLEKTDEQSEAIIRDVLGAEPKEIKHGVNRAGEKYMDIFDPRTGRGVRLKEDSHEFDTFVNRD